MKNHARALSRHRGRTLAAAVLLAIGGTTPLLAQPHFPTGKLAPIASKAVSTQTIRHQQARPLTPSERAPQPASRDHLFVDYDRPLRDKSGRMLRTRATPTCDVNALAAASGSNLVSLVRNASVDGCINTLFNVTGSNAGQLFGEAKMVTIADALRTDSVSYAGDDRTGTLQLILFLRAGYYVQFYDSTDVGSYGTALKNAIRPALDAFVANSHFHDVNDQHGAVLSEFVTLIDSAGENAHQLPTLRDLLDRYNASYHPYYNMMAAVNGVFSVLFRGHQNADFVSAVQASPSILTSLSGFISRNAAEAGTANEYLLSNAGRELARFVQYGTLAPTVRPLVGSILNSYSMTGRGASIWVATADTVDYLDHANCSYYGICDFKTRLAAAVLPISHDCSPTIHLRAQALTSSQIDQVCTSVINEADFFHQKVADNSTPVANDDNTRLELDIFHSSSDYSTYAGVIFGNDTNNGGIYLEGDPSDPANQPRFIAYEAEWLRPAFEVWNLTHEYVHYLDGRFDMYGDFNDYIAVPSVWWMEGLAEYMSYSYRGIPYPEAIADAGTRQFPLSTVFANDYNSGEERVYRWGYLAVRYMFEKQPADVGSILGYFRPGNYTGYASYLQSIRYNHDSDWNNWLTCLNTNQGDTASCGGGSQPPPPSLPECSGNASVLQEGCQRSNVAAGRAGDAQYFYIYLPANAAPLTFATTGGTGNADLYVSGSHWPSTASYDQRSVNSGNQESITVTPPAAGGYYYVAVIARTPYSGVALSVQQGSGSGNPPPPAWPECTGDNRVLASGCQRSHVEASRQGDTQYFYLMVPAGKTGLHVETSAGSGDASLYVSARGWPSASDYDEASVHPGNAESVDIASPRADTYYYIAVTAAAPYSGVTVKAQLMP